MTYSKRSHLSGYGPRDQMVVLHAPDDLYEAPFDYGAYYRDASNPRAVFARDLASRRSWSYALTFWTGVSSIHDPEGLREFIHAWEAECQPLILDADGKAGRFERVFVPEPLDGLWHLHGLVYLEHGPAPEYAEIMASVWGKGMAHLRRLQPKHERTRLNRPDLQPFYVAPEDGERLSDSPRQSMAAGFRWANYMLKNAFYDGEFGGSLTRPVFASRSLNHEAAEFRSPAPSPSKRSGGAHPREMAFWRADSQN